MVAGAITGNVSTEATTQTGNMFADATRGLTSPAYEILDVTFAMNLGWAKTREQCEKLVIYQAAHTAPGKDVYHPMLIGPEIFNQTGATASREG